MEEREQEKREQEKRKVVGCYIYSRSDGDSLHVYGGVWKPTQELGGRWDNGYAYMHLLNTEGDISGVRRAVKSLVKSLQKWLEDPENAASAGPGECCKRWCVQRGSQVIRGAVPGGPVK